MHITSSNRRMHVCTAYTWTQTQALVQTYESIHAQSHDACTWTHRHMKSFTHAYVHGDTQLHMCMRTRHMPFVPCWPTRMPEARCPPAWHRTVLWLRPRSTAGLGTASVGCLQGLQGASGIPCCLRNLVLPCGHKQGQLHPLKTPWG